jgi:nicotinate-nucleotide adenylyltransferase
MTRLAIASDAGFAISLADAPKPSGQPNYTLDTLLALRAELPPASALFCLMGADSLAGFRRWHRAAEIPFAAPLIVASRPGENLRDLEAWLPVGLSIEPIPEPFEPNQQIELRSYRLRNPAGATTPFYLLPGLEIEISASEIRDQLQTRDQRMSRDQLQTQSQPPERQLLPSAVSDYIREHDLYV